MAEETESLPENESVRLDIWLWATRLSKTRSLATSACKRNRVEVNGQTVKASRSVRAGDRIQYRRGPLTRTVEVKAILSKRVGAMLVGDFLIDHTPKEEYEKAATVNQENRSAKPKRDSGAGRPTKKDRRDLSEVMEESAEEASAFDAFSKAMKKNLK